MQITDRQIRACEQGNRVAQKQVYLYLLPYLRTVGIRYLQEPSYIKDVLQECFIKVFKSMHSYDASIAPLKKWSARIMINVCLNYNSRIIGNRKETLDESSGYHILPLPFIDEISDERLLYVLKKMPKAYLEVFNLNIIDGYRHDEIAALLNISTTTSRKRLSRARTWIKKTMPEKEITNSTQTAQKNINNES